MDIDTDTLLAPVSPDSPAGRDLSDHKDRVEIDDIFRQSADMAAGDDGEAARIEWRDVVKSLTGLLKQSKDLRLAVYLMRAGAQWGRLSVIEAGAVLLQGFLEQYWDQVHPAEADDGVYYGRVHGLAILANRRAFLKLLENVVVIDDDRQGRFTVGEIATFARDGAPTAFQAALRNLGTEPVDTALASFVRIQSALAAAGAAFIEHDQERPNLSATQELLERFTAGLRAFAGAPATATAEAAPSPASSPSETPLSAPVPAKESVMTVPNVASSRADVVRMLDAICDYYAAAEPSSPVPILLKRARGWVDMPFIDLLKDIAPGGVADAGRLLGDESAPKN